MKVADFLRNDSGWLEHEYELPDREFMVQYQDMSQVWEASNDPILMCRILRTLNNSNYDLPLIFFVIKCANECSQDETAQMVGEAITAIESYYEGKSDIAVLKKFRTHYDMLTRQFFVSEKSRKEKRGVYALNCALMWLTTNHPLAAVSAARFIAEQIIYANLAGSTYLANVLRECIGNPFLT